MKTPVVIFAFNRPDSLSRLIESIKSNPGHGEHEYHIFVDGARKDEERDAVREVIRIARSFTDNVHASETNRGLGPSIISGVSEIIRKTGQVIVLEDDLVLMPGFLNYMEEGLRRYRDDGRIFSVCGYGLKIRRPAGYEGDVYLNNRSSSWGWGTWADRWETVDWDVKDFPQLKESKSLQRAFNRGGSDMFGMLKGYMEGANRSWAIRFCYAQHRQGKYSVHPFRSQVANEGFGLNASNCRQSYSRFKVTLDTTGDALEMPLNPEVNEGILGANRRYHSIPIRIYSKIRKILNV